MPNTSVTQIIGIIGAQRDQVAATRSIKATNGGANGASEIARRLPGSAADVVRLVAEAA